MKEIHSTPLLFFEDSGKFDEDFTHLCENKKFYRKNKNSKYLSNDICFSIR